ncbi:hypothetical protein POF50_012495 [Streptomyces sp. SL13]|uniref:ATP-binding protein n=1 Tax=Streptantibioticus silvisoli TaxID=2705255 RepID=A0AA90GYR6_9ACTN|nr:hypothetical protein [Streptantibioticus silvisoli]MDI5967372.1 hypothetical protein [Streptantibioticus silvisoli]MDI5970149.1 hypothetical protein [Streptantibioticus silvisoli]
MKSGTLKTLGAAALGVAFAAAAAGTASAAPALPANAPASALDSLTTQLPLTQVTGLVPGAAQATGALQGALHNVPAALSGGKNAGLLGGLPLGSLGGSGLPLGG